MQFANYLESDVYYSWSVNIFYCLLNAISKVQFVDRKASFLFVNDVNAHHEEWLGSSTTKLHGRAARDFATLLGCEQMIADPTYVDGSMLDLVLTDVPNVVGARVGSLVRT